MAKYIKTEDGYKPMTELDSQFLSKTDPKGVGSFSLNRKSGTEIGRNSHAEGSSTAASGNSAHAEGSNTTASGSYSHTEGDYTKASASSSHAEGSGTVAYGVYSHTEGNGTTASGKSTHVQGEYNIDQGGNNVSRSIYAHIVGNGTSNLNRSNAHTLDWSGNAWFAGNIKIGGSGQDDTTAKTLATVDDVQSLAPKSTTITLAVADWTGDASPYSQTVTVDGITAMSKIDLQPTPEQLLELQESAVTLMIVNNNGTATAYAIGFKPTKDYTMKILITETR